jgi:hypothetical protein
VSHLLSAPEEIAKFLAPVLGQDGKVVPTSEALARVGRQYQDRSGKAEGR